MLTRCLKNLQSRSISTSIGKSLKLNHCTSMFIFVYVNASACQCNNKVLLAMKLFFKCYKLLESDCLYLFNFQPCFIYKIKYKYKNFLIIYYDYSHYKKINKFFIHNIVKFKPKGTLTNITIEFVLKQNCHRVHLVKFKFFWMK